MSNRRAFIKSIAGVVGATIVKPALSQQPAAGTTPDQVPTYQPPRRGAPASRVGGGSRGTATGPVRLTAIAPDHTGLSFKSQPTFLWHSAGPLTNPVELTLVDSESVKPLIEHVIPTPLPAGVHMLRLADFELRLKAKVEYRWHVAAILNPEQRSNDVIASATVERVEPDQRFQDALARLKGLAKVHALAGAGIWYDAIDELYGMLRADPASPDLRTQYHTLLRQVGLEMLG